MDLDPHNKFFFSSLHGNDVTIRIGQEIQCLLYAGLSSVEYKAFIIFAELLKFGISYIEKYFLLIRCCHKMVTNVDYFCQLG